jgi:CubicO group peptidase (beta-lactamase class C family)
VVADSFGLANVENGTPVSVDTVFQVASLSKSVSAWGVMRLVEAGVLALDAPVDQYLVSWHLPASNFSSQEVTVRRLLSHTAGLAVWNYPGVPVEDTHPALVDLLSGIESAQAVNLKWQPGSRGEYTNAGYLLLQLLIEDVMGGSLAEYMQRQVLSLLRMSHSSFQWSPELRELAATGYDLSGKPVALRWYPEAAGGLYSTVTDMATWLAAGMPGSNAEPAGRGVLQPQSLEQMYAQAPVAEGSSSGLGYDIETLPNGVRMIWHTGDVLGWRGQYAMLPERGEGIVVLTNSNTGRYVITDVICAWTQWAAGSAPSVCQVYQALYLAIPVIACFIGLITVIHLLRLITQVTKGQRRISWPPEGDQQKRDFSLPWIVIALWWVLVEPRLGSLLPPSFLWISLMFTFWCLIAVMKSLAVKAADL